MRSMASVDADADVDGEADAAEEADEARADREHEIVVSISDETASPR